MLKLLIGILIFLFILNPQFVEAKVVLVVEMNGVITPATLETFKSSLDYAGSINAEAIILTLDTPGGGVDETLEIIKLMDRAKIPVISYVYPKGATAWSAGTLILISSHVAAMAPHTVIGSAQPVEISSGGVIPLNQSKIINALTTFIAERARTYGRNETAAKAFITENLNLNPEQAKDIKVIEFISPSIEELLQQVDGLNISTIPKTLDTADAEVAKFSPSPKLQFLNLISNPLLASLFLLIGIYAIIFGVSSPGVGSEIAGVVLIVLGLLGLGFNVNILAIFLLIFGAALILVELNTPGFGILGGGGIIAIIIGSVLLIPTTFPRYFISEEFQKSMIAAVVAPSIVFGVFLAFALKKVIEIRRKKPKVGELIGEEAIAVGKITRGKKGYVMYAGEYWEAESDQIIKPKERVIIVGKSGPILVVKKKS
ncbi:MAG: nodulation protein NfeD [Candidatus Aenigmarchaeota archaeon]|nr:nodulation protein NfeD [Candidatus Aenigmarchaeota archaeon]